ncbi:MAG: hypothetical protein ACHBN1_21745 [Heteroscytonema crispum UTEX LB 1556]
MNCPYVYLMQTGTAILEDCGAWVTAVDSADAVISASIQYSCIVAKKPGLFWFNQRNVGLSHNRNRVFGINESVF